MRIGMRVLNALRIGGVVRIHETGIFVTDDAKAAEIIEKESGVNEMLALLREYRDAYPAKLSKTLGSCIENHCDNILQKYGERKDIYE